MKTAIVPIRNYSQITLAYSRIKNLPDVIRERMILISGESGLGKSTLCGKLCVELGGIWIEADSTDTPYGILSKIVRDLGSEPKRSATETLALVTARLKASGRPLFIDEVNRIADNRKVLDVLRAIHDKAKSVIVFVGNETVPRLLSRDEQLDSRFIEKLKFYLCNDEDIALLAEQLCEVKISPDQYADILKETKGSTRRIIHALAERERVARQQKWTDLSRNQWQSHLERKEGKS